jgi:hypothetical protein
VGGLPEHPSLLPAAELGTTDAELGAELAGGAPEGVAQGPGAWIRRCSKDTGSEQGYRRPLAGQRGRQSELFIPEAHAIEPGIGLLEVPTVIGFEHIGDGDHQIKEPALIKTLLRSGLAQG